MDLDIREFCKRYKVSRRKATLILAAGLPGSYKRDDGSWRIPKGAVPPQREKVRKAPKGRLNDEVSPSTAARYCCGAQWWKKWVAVAGRKPTVKEVVKEMLRRGVKIKGLTEEKVQWLQSQE